jgi:hypothetical protein
MAYQYFYCSWVIQPTITTDKFVLLARTAKNLECHFNLKLVLRNGLQVIDFVFRVPSEDVFYKLKEQIKEIFDLMNWEQASGIDYDDSPAWLSGIYAGGDVADSFRRLKDIGGLNQAIIRSEKYTFTCDWVIRRLTDDDLIRIFDILHEWGYSLYYQPKLESPSSKMIFIAKVLNLSTMETFVDQLKPFMTLTNWVYVDPSSSVSIMDQAKLFTRENQADFLNLVSTIF